MGSTSRLVRANPQSTSIRTTVPNAVVEQLELREGDILDWDIRSEGEKKYVIVKKVKDEEEL